MVLPPQQVERFYHIWFNLLHFVNEQKHLLPSFPANPGIGTVQTEDALKLREVLWEDDTILPAFVAQNPANLSRTDLTLVESWQQRVSSDFYIMKFLKKYTVFLDTKEPPHLYGVLGLVSPLEEVVGYFRPPIYVRAVLLPFEGQITYDGLLAPYNIYFGPGIRSSLKEAYRNAEERQGILISLLPQAPEGSLRPFEDATKQISARNTKLLNAFQKDLAQSGLSLKMIEQHTDNLKNFGQQYLLAQNPPRGLLELTPADLKDYLQTLPEKGARAKTLTSFKRFVRFLYRTGRIHPDQEEALTQALKE
jgi:hypothetical protein